MNLPTQHATAPGSDPYQDLVHALSKVVAPLQALQQQAVEALAPTRKVQRPVTLYNLDDILAVGDRVRSPRGEQCRRWASTRMEQKLGPLFIESTIKKRPMA